MLVQKFPDNFLPFYNQIVSRNENLLFQKFLFNGGGSIQSQEQLRKQT